ncbi:hypothetical protein N8303_04550 [Gammaproteobacteria bacterium]|nr:hypothetical protein [Gammaproteobacteria bacterium]
MKFPKMPYKPLGLWSYHDFAINKYYWMKHGLEYCEQIRIKNLIDVHNVLDTNNITHWLQGKTLLGIFKYGRLLNDHDDDLGIFIEDRNEIISSVKNDLLELGFSLIRSNDEIISFQRNFRYIDICLFKKSNNYIGYANKYFKHTYFSEFDIVRWESSEFHVPMNSTSLLRSMYPKNSFIKTFRLLLTLSKHPNKICKLKSIIANRLPIIFQYPILSKIIARTLASVVGAKVKVLPEDDFLELAIEDIDSFNWGWRKRHLNLVTNGGKYRKLFDLVEYLSKPENIRKIDSSVIETDTSKAFYPPSNYDMRFWWGGNNYFWYCVKYEFRKNVTPYAQINRYISNNDQPFLFTSQYFESLEIMSDKEIESFLTSHPIEIKNKSIISGKHRVFAMLGRLAAGKKYIPLTVIERR